MYVYKSYISPLFYMYFEGLAGLKVPMLAISGLLLSSSKTSVGATPHGSPHVQVLGGLAIAFFGPRGWVKTSVKKPWKDPVVHIKIAAIDGYKWIFYGFFNGSSSPQKLILIDHEIDHYFHGYLWVYWSWLIHPHMAFSASEHVKIRWVITRITSLRISDIFDEFGIRIWHSFAWSQVWGVQCFVSKNGFRSESFPRCLFKIVLDFLTVETWSLPTSRPFGSVSGAMIQYDSIIKKCLASSSNWWANRWDRMGVEIWSAKMVWKSVQNYDTMTP